MFSLDNTRTFQVVGESTRGNVGRFLNGFRGWILPEIGVESGCDAVGSCEIGIGLWVAGDLEQRELGVRAVGGREAGEWRAWGDCECYFLRPRPATRLSSAGLEMEVDENPSGQ